MRNNIRAEPDENDGIEAPNSVDIIEIHRLISIIECALTEKHTQSYKDDKQKWIPNPIKDNLNKASKDHQDECHEQAEHNVNTISENVNMNTYEEEVADFNERFPDMKWEEFNLIIHRKIPLPKGNQNIAVEEKIQRTYLRRKEKRTNRNKSYPPRTSLYAALSQVKSESTIQLDDYSSSEEENTPPVPYSNDESWEMIENETSTQARIL